MTGPSVLTLGEGLGVLRTSGIGSLAQLPDLLVGTGGAESNVAIGLARLGISVTWLGRVGDDGLGRRVTRELRAEGVQVVAPIDTTAPTGLLIKEHPSPGRTFVTYHRAGSAGSRLRPSDLDPVDIGSFSLLHLTGITPALSPSARATVRVAVARAQAAGVPISFDVNHRSTLWPDEDPAPLYREFASASRLVFAGADEAAILASDPVTAPLGLAAEIAKLGPEEVVITLGADGAVAVCGEKATWRDALPVPVVDTVGAGDAFVAGYLAEWLLGGGIDQRLDLAVRTGAAACTHPGDWEGFLFRSQLDVDGDDPVRR
ncbi:sugar kinase [Diaminobutyricibacter sp. McL0618]|uniref:sugar kinase n=1 Tax=Leifsonia sp. McL0618 TaxID=3415677 RepID=UPI003CFA7663